MNFSEERAKRTAEIDRLLLDFLPAETGAQKTVIGAMNYSVTAGGKRLRPMLMLETYRLFGGTGRTPAPFMAAMEMIHTYSLVHDDLPAMDNDEYRRGKKTTHAVYGEAMAILAGDALLNYAVETAVKAFAEIDEDAPDAASVYARTACALTVLMKKAGIYGMVGGQTVDVEAENKTIDDATLDFIFENKTGALIEGSMMIGAILAGANEEQTACVEQIASKIGRAFQIQDDVLDVTGTTEELGKPAHSDEKNNKPTYVTMHGLDAAHADVAHLTKEALALLSKLEMQLGREEWMDAFLRELLLSLAERKK